MASRTPSELARACYAAYQARDRDAIEGLLSQDFVFSSPLDDHIDRATYFELCWPNSEIIKAFTIEQAFEQGDEVFVRYTAETYAGKIFHNIEFFRTANGEIIEVDVYFGRTIREEAA